MGTLHTGGFFLFNAAEDPTPLLSAFHIEKPRTKKSVPTPPFWINAPCTWIQFDPNTESLHIEPSWPSASLYYIKTDNAVVFSTDIAPLLALQTEGASLDHHSHILYHQYGCSQRHHTLFKGIHRLPPDHTLTIHTTGLRITPKEATNRSAGVLSTQQDFESYLCEHLLSQRPNGPLQCFLEQPADLFLAFLSRSQQDVSAPSLINLHTVTFEDGSSALPDVPMDGLTIHHHPLIEQHFWSLLPTLTKTLAEPCPDPKIVLHYFLGEQAQKNTTPGTLVTALGADVLLGARDHYRKVSWPSRLGGGIIPPKGTLDIFEETPWFFNEWRELIDQTHPITESLTPLQHSQYITWENRFTLAEQEAFLALTPPCWQGSLYAPFLNNLLKDSLLYGLKDSLKVKHGEGGFGFYQLMRNLFSLLDMNILGRYNQDMLNTWLRHKGQRLASVVARQEGIAGIFSRSYVRNLFSCRTSAHTQAAWSLLFFALWHQAHIKKITPVPDTFSFLAKQR